MLWLFCTQLSSESHPSAIPASLFLGVYSKATLVVFIRIITHSKPLHTKGHLFWYNLFCLEKRTMTTTTTTSFAAFTDGADVIQRTLDAVQGEKTQHDQINAVYEIEECVEWIKSNGFKRVCEFHLHVPKDLFYLVVNKCLTTCTGRDLNGVPT